MGTTTLSLTLYEQKPIRASTRLQGTAGSRAEPTELSGFCGPYTLARWMGTSADALPSNRRFERSQAEGCNGPHSRGTLNPQDLTGPLSLRARAAPAYAGLRCYPVTGA